MTDDDQRSDDEILRELMALAAVDALDADDQAHVEVLIADRPDLQAEYRDLREAAATMAAATAETPPPTLRANVLDAIAKEPRSAAAAPTWPDRREPSPASTPSPSADDLPAPAPVVPLPANRGGGWLLPLLAAAAAVILVVAAAAIVRRGGDDPNPGDQVAAVLEDPDSVVMPFGGEVGNLAMVYSDDEDAAVLSGSGVTAPEGSDVFELWGFEGETPVRMEIFRPTDSGVVEVYLEDVDVDDDARFAITIEPAGGTDAPTGPTVGDTA